MPNWNSEMRGKLLALAQHKYRFVFDSNIGLDGKLHRFDHTKLIACPRSSATHPRRARPAMSRKPWWSHTIVQGFVFAW